MTELQEIRVRLALVGARGSGKSAALEAYHETVPAHQRSPLTRIGDLAGKTLVYDHAEFEMGVVSGLPIYVDVYALPGQREAELARRISLSGCHGYLFTADCRSFAYRKTLEAFTELKSYLSDRGREPKDAALVALLTHADKSKSGSNKAEIMLLKELGRDRLIRVGEDTRERVGEAIKKAAALALSREREELEAQRAGKPPPRLKIPGQLIGDVERAHEIYLRSAGIAGSGFSPHSDPFFGQVLLQLGAASEEDLEVAANLKAQALGLGLDVTLEEILSKRELVDPEVLPRARRVHHCVEVIHEEVLFGRVASELNIVPFQRVKRALTLQVKRNFQHSLDHLLTRAGQLDRVARQRILKRLSELHQVELARDQEADRAGTINPPTRSFRAGESELPLFGEVAINLGLITRAQAREAVTEQKRLRRKGTRRFFGEVLKLKGYLNDEEIPMVCRALEERIADDRIEGYQIYRSLGRGNMALVFAAKQIKLDRIVALKILDPKLLFDSAFIERFAQEAKIAARLNHQNIVQAYDVGSDNDLHYFVMEYVDGVTVKDLIDDAGVVDPDTAIDIVIQTARALDHASKHSLVHRDVKPGNIMVNREGTTKLCDLGLALRTDRGGTGDSVVLGTPFYISPEQITNDPNIDVRADLYSLGATWYHMLTGRPPFTAPTPEEVCIRHLNDPVPDASRINTAVTPPMIRVLNTMMAKQREDRYESAAVVIRELLKLRPNAGGDEHREDLARRIALAYPAREPWD
ncbi:MAG: protein kinase [Planctomycetes bacterium]|nr:protein kinase [Planctomycetota bacterium]